MSNNLIKSLQAEKLSNRQQNSTPDLYCRTLQNYYEASKQERKVLRESVVSTNNEIAVSTNMVLQKFMSNLKTASVQRLVGTGNASGGATAAAIVSKAMKNAHRKLQEEKVFEEKEEKGDEVTGANWPLYKRKYGNSVTEKYVSFSPKHQIMDVVDRGISLKGLRTILEEYNKNAESFKNFQLRHPETEKFIRCPGENLTHMLVKPETRESDCYIELLYGVFLKKVMDTEAEEETEEEVNFIKRELDETLGTVNVFVSHTWAYEFRTLFESVEQWEKNWEKVNGKKHQTFYYFVDYFAVNQHNQESDLSKLHEVVGKSKVTCLVLTPWYKPKPLLRCWCIYEIAKTELFPGTRLDVAFPPNEIKNFKKNFFDAEKVREISRMIESVDSKNADASHKPDKEMIEKEIRSNPNLGGFQRVNELCIRNLRKWLIDQACEFADEEARGDYHNASSEKVAYEKAYWVLKNVGTFLRQQGKFEKSIKYLRHAMNIMGELYAVDLDEKEEGIRLSETNYKFERAYHKIKIGLAKKIEGDEEIRRQKGYFLKLLNSLANALTDDKQFHEAEEIYRKTFEWRKELLKSNNKDTKMTQFNLAVCLIHQKKYDEAEKILNENLRLWTEKEKYRCWALFNLADLKSKTKRPDEADKDFEQACYELRKKFDCKERDRFFCLANVLWSKHLLRYADAFEDDMKKTTMLKTALEKANLAYNNFRLNSDLTHPDTRLAARAKRRLELKLNPELKDKENSLRYDLIKNTYNRPWRGVVTESDDQIKPNKIRVMHWNLLADKLAYPDFKKGGFGCSFDLLDWNKCRKDKVCAEIIKYSPDVLVVVELDHYEDIRFILQEDFGYESIWKKKNRNFYTDGTGIFWKKERFESGHKYKKPLAKELGSLKEADQVFVAVELFPRKELGDDFIPFVVGGCHLKSTKKSKGEVSRLDQCKQIVKILEGEFYGRPVILGADMNAEAKSTMYDALAYPYVTGNGMVSAYQSVLGKEPEYTSWKFRIDEDDNFLFRDKHDIKNVVEWKYTVDFIFHSGEVKSLSVLDMPEEKEIDNAFGELKNDSEKMVAFAKRRCLLPNARCPSDHLPILANVLLPQQMGKEVERRPRCFSLLDSNM